MTSHCKVSVASPDATPAPGANGIRCCPCFDSCLIPKGRIRSSLPLAQLPCSNQPPSRRCTLREIFKGETQRQVEPENVVFITWSTASILVVHFGASAGRCSRPNRPSRRAKSRALLNSRFRPSTCPWTCEMTLPTVLKRPSAFLPLAMSVAALVLVLGHVAVAGAARQADEGAAAHIFQLLIAGQVPLVAFFAIKWLPRAPRFSLPVLALQAIAVIAALAPVYFFNL